jgi:hypothetical protein
LLGGGVTAVAVHIFDGVQLGAAEEVVVVLLGELNVEGATDEGAADEVVGICW